LPLLPQFRNEVIHQRSCQTHACIAYSFIVRVGKLLLFIVRVGLVGLHSLNNKPLIYNVKEKVEEKLHSKCRCHRAADNVDYRYMYFNSCHCKASW